MIAGEPQSMKHARNEYHSIGTELRVICAIAGDGGSRITSHVVSTRFVITNHETSKSRISRILAQRDSTRSSATAPGRQVRSRWIAVGLMRTR